jgi:hypothetical protein
MFLTFKKQEIDTKEERRQEIENNVRNPIGTCQLHYKGEKRIEPKRVEERRYHQHYC